MAGPGVVIGKVSVKVIPDTTNFRRELKAKLDAIERSSRLNLKVNLDLEDIDNRLREVERKLDDIRDEFDGEDIEFHPGVSEPAFRHVQARLAVLTRPRTVEIIPQVNKAAMARATATLTALSGLRVVNRYMRSTIDLLSNLDRRIPALTALANGIGLVSSMALAGTSNLFALSASLASIAGAGLALPGILGGIAFGVGATMAVLKDAPEILADVGQRFSRLQDQMSETFWSQAERPIRRMINELFPQLAAGLRGTADSLATYFSNISDSLRRALSGRLEGMFNNLNRSIEIAAGGTDSLAGAIATLGTTGSNYLPRLAQWFVRISDQFNAWLQAAAADGRLKEWIEAGIQALSDLGNVLRGVGRIFYGIASAAQEAGGAVLGTLGEALNSIADTVNSEPFRSNLVMVFEAAHEAMDNLASAAGPGVTRFFQALAGVLDRILPLIGEVVGELTGALGDALAQPGLTGGLEQMFQGMADGIRALLPSVAPLANALGSILSVVGTLAANLGPVLAPAIDAVSESIIAMTPVVQFLADLLGGVLATILNALGPALGPLVTYITALVGVYKMWTAAQIALNTAMRLNPIGIIIGLVAGLVAAFIHFWNTSEAFRQFWIGLWGSIQGVVMGAVNLIRGFIMSFINGVVQMFQGFFDIVMGIWNTFAGLFTGDWSRAWNGVKQILSGIWNAIVGAFKTWLNIGIFRFAKGILTAIASFFRKSWQGIASIIRVIWNGISRFFSSIWSGIRSTFSGALNGIRGIVQSVFNAIKNFFSGAMNSVKRIGASALNGLRSIFRGGLNRLKSAVQSAINGVTNIFSGLKDRVLGFFSNAGSWLYDSGKSIIQGFGDGLRSAMGSVSDSVGGFLSGIRDKFPFSPAKEGPFSGKGWVYYSGISIAEGLAQGILDARKQAESAADRLAGVTRNALPSTMPGMGQADYGDDTETQSAGNVTIHQTVYNPLQQPAAQQTNSALQMAAALGI